MRWRQTAAGGRGTPLVVAVVAAVALAGCGASSHDTPAFAGKPVTGEVTDAPTPPTAPGAPSGSEVVLVHGVPQLVRSAGAGAGAADAALRALAGRLAAGGRSCDPTTTRADGAVVSVRWLCSDRSVATASFAVASGRRLGLGDLLRGGYLPYMASTAQAQLTAGGATPAAAAAVAAPSAAAFSGWDLTPASLEVTFPLPAGPATVAYPLSTLASFAVPGGLLR